MDGARFSVMEKERILWEGTLTKSRRDPRDDFKGRPFVADFLRFRKYSFVAGRTRDGVGVGEMFGGNPR